MVEAGIVVPDGIVSAYALVVVVVILAELEIVHQDVRLAPCSYNHFRRRTYEMQLHCCLERHQIAIDGH